MVVVFTGVGLEPGCLGCLRSVYTKVAEKRDEGCLATGRETRPRYAEISFWPHLTFPPPSSLFAHFVPCYRLGSPRPHGNRPPPALYGRLARGLTTRKVRRRRVHGLEKISIGENSSIGLRMERVDFLLAFFFRQIGMAFDIVF